MPDPSPTPTEQRFWNDAGIRLRVEGPGLPAGGTLYQSALPIVRIGRYQEMDIILDDPAISQRHVYLHRTDDGIFLMDLGSRSGIRLGGVVLKQGWLPPGCELELGPFRVFIDVESGGADEDLLYRIPATEDQLRGVKVILTNRRGSRMAHPLKRALTILGKGTPSTLRIPNAVIGRAHLALFRTPDAVWAIDLYGTQSYANAKRFQVELLTEASVVSIGELTLRFQFAPRGDDASDSSATKMADRQSDAELKATSEDPGGFDDVELESNPDARRQRAKDELAALQNEMRSHREGDTTFDADAWQSRLNQVSADLQALEQLLSEMERRDGQRIAEVEERAAHLQRQLDQALSKEGKLSGTQAEILRRNDELTFQIQALKTAADRTSSQLADQVRQAQAFRDRESALQRTVDEFRSEKAILERKLNDSSRNIERLARDLERRQVEIEQFVLERDSLSLSASVAEDLLNQQSADHEQVRENLREQIEELRLALSDARAFQSSMANELALARQKVAELDASNANLQEQLKASKDAVGLLEQREGDRARREQEQASELTRLREIVQSRSQSEKETERREENLLAENQRLTSLLENQALSLRSMETRIDDLATQLNRRAEELEVLRCERDDALRRLQVSAEKLEVAQRGLVEEEARSRALADALSTARSSVAETPVSSDHSKRRADQPQPVFATAPPTTTPSAIADTAPLAVADATTGNLDRVDESGDVVKTTEMAAAPAPVRDRSDETPSWNNFPPLRHEEHLITAEKLFRRHARLERPRRTLLNFVWILMILLSVVGAGVIGWAYSKGMFDGRDPNESTPSGVSERSKRTP